MSTFHYNERCSCGATYAASGYYLSSAGVERWRHEHHHAEPSAPPAAPRARLPRTRARVRRLATVPRRATPDPTHESETTP